MKKIILIGISFISLLTSIVLVIHIVDREINTVRIKDNIINIDKNGAHQILEIGKLSVLPGKEEDHTIGLSVIQTNTYIIQMDFIEIEDGGLGNFLRIKITVDDEVIFESSLKELMSGTNLVGFNLALDAEMIKDIKITYYLLVDVGNEAMKKYSKFNIKVDIEPLGENR